MERIKVRITCKVCGEHFILRARKEGAKLDTGFKQCLCNNTDYFEIVEEPA